MTRKDMDFILEIHILILNGPVAPLLLGLVQHERQAAKELLYYFFGVDLHAFGTRRSRYNAHTQSQGYYLIIALEVTRHNTRPQG